MDHLKLSYQNILPRDLGLVRVFLSKIILIMLDHINQNNNLLTFHSNGINIYYKEGQLWYKSLKQLINSPCVEFFTSFSKAGKKI